MLTLFFLNNNSLEHLNVLLRITENISLFYILNNLYPN